MASWRRSPRGGRRAAASATGAGRGLPMPVAQTSSSDSRVGASWPRRVFVSSRLRCVAGGRSIRSAALHGEAPHVRQRLPLRVIGIAPERGCGRLRDHQSAAPRAAMDATRSGAQSFAVPSSDRVPFSRRVVVAVAESTVFGADRARPGLPRREPRQPAAARARCIRQADLAVGRAVQARPNASRRRAIASRIASLFSASRSLSVSVPGVTMRTTLRSTGPLPAPTSPTCSQIATDSPARTSLAR